MCKQKPKNVVKRKPSSIASSITRFRTCSTERFRLFFSTVQSLWVTVGSEQGFPRWLRCGPSRGSAIVQSALFREKPLAQLGTTEVGIEDFRLADEPAGLLPLSGAAQTDGQM